MVTVGETAKSFRHLGTADQPVETGWVAVYWGGFTADRLGFGRRGEPIRTLPDPWWEHADVSPGDRLSLLGSPSCGSTSSESASWVSPSPGLDSQPLFRRSTPCPRRRSDVSAPPGMGFQLVAAYLGAAGVPWILGIFAEEAGLETLCPGLFATALLLSVVHVISDRAGKRLVV